MSRQHFFSRGLLAAALLSVAASVGAQDNTPTPEITPIPDSTPHGIPAEVTGTALVIPVLPFDDAFLNRLQLPEGFEINVFAKGMGNVRMMEVMPDGTIFVTRRAEGDVIALTDANNDGVADETSPNVAAADLPVIHGIEYDGNQVYLVIDGKLLVADWTGGPTLGTPREVISDLPQGGQHPSSTMSFGPDGLLYLTIGSTCNACDDPNPENATMLVIDPATFTREIYAEGLRNTIGFSFHPTTGNLWGMDHGSDWRGDDQPPEELNLIEQGNHYGWPFCFGDRLPDLYVPTSPPSGLGTAAFCSTTTGATLEYTAHSAPIGLVFYTADQFPADYQNDAFVAMRGSWNRSEPSGYKIVRLLFDEGGEPTGFEDFITGWLIEEDLANFGRVAGLAIAPDGSLLISEDQNGVIYRVSYTGN